jgi:histidinol phosphatase-like enzyme (inositol monophosphatase family)
MDLAPFRTFMTELAVRSGDFIRPFFADPSLTVELKADQTPVTLADRGAEELMRGLIRRKFPGHGIIGEEFGSENENAEFVWVLDPVDGTKAFMTACPLFGTLIALQHRGVPVLGAIHQPVLRQLLIGDGETSILYSGEPGSRGRTVRIRPCPRVEDATLLCSNMLSPHKYRNGRAFDALTRRARLVRTWGDCYGYLLVATGWADVMCDPIMNPWDIQALVPIIRGAGGVVTDWNGGDPVKADSLVAAGPELHGRIISALGASTAP